MSKLIRLKEVIDRIGLSRTTIYDMMKDGRFPRQVILGQRSVAWHEDAINQWIASRSSKNEPAER